MSHHGPTRTVELTEEQIVFLQTALDASERALRDPSYDPQVQEWASRHATDSLDTVARIRHALANSSPESAG
ncbi:MAG: hypothetical protein M3515_01605 [Actinomycetota bacterium]|jgi:hypothetical protein|nr:hypothetical protein [Actinomycetota bacterium]MDQ3318946.1 hypothetical protein [Actinomycetota bacterium]MDQ3356366.1 hypothetical protein [Actinomycetota bacterium]